MARAGKRGGGGGGRGLRRTGIEKYGRDEADEVLRLDEDVCGGEEASEDDIAEEDIFKLKPYEEEEEGAKPAKVKKGKKKRRNQEEDDEEPEEERLEKAAQGTKGWRKEDFYGGDDGGDDSDKDSDEDLVMEEARRLEELRARRLKGEVDPLVALLGESKLETSESTLKEPAAAVPGTGSGASAQFEALFAAEAERGIVQKDLAALPESKRRGLLKSEAPELVPLLTDFRSKLEGLRQIMPLLDGKAFAHMPASGVSYLKAKAALILNTLANLSFYLLLRAEGGSVRSHPVISQLVWLRELHEKMAPLDERMAPALKKALRNWKKLQRVLSIEEADALGVQTSGQAVQGTAAAAQEDPAPARRPTLRERFWRTCPAPPEEPTVEAKAARTPAVPAAAAPQELSTADLLRLPARRRREGGSHAGVPADLDEVDPLLGGWRPGGTLAEQLLEVRQHLGERAAKAKAVSADLDVEAQQWRARQRVREAPEDIEATMAGRPEARKLAPEENMEEEDELIKGAKATAEAKKARRAAASEAKKQALLAQQFKPEAIIEGRRATSKKILKNRGLVRQRKKEAGNARVTNRKRYEKAVKRRRGAVQEVREGAADGATYEGEATGVRTHLKKSLRLG